MSIKKTLLVLLPFVASIAGASTPNGGPTPPPFGQTPIYSGSYTYTSGCSASYCSVGCSALMGCEQRTIYNQPIRIAAGNLQLQLLTLANAAAQFYGRGGEEIECLAEDAARATWNFKQIAGMSNVKYYLIDQVQELQMRVSLLKQSFLNLSLSGERSVLDPFNTAASSWQSLMDQLNALPQ